MADALSEALQKLSIAKTQPQSVVPCTVGIVPTHTENAAADPAPAVASTASLFAADHALVAVVGMTSPSEGAMGAVDVHATPTACAAVDGQSHEPSAPLLVPLVEPNSLTDPELSGSSEATATVETEDTAEVTPVAASVAKTTFVPMPAWRRAASYLLDNRRHAAAVVVLVCMGLFWFEDSTAVSPSSESSGALIEDFSDVEAALSEFDVQAAPPLKEPAEPVDVSSGFDLMIPAGDMNVGSNESSSSGSETAAAYPDSPGALEVPAANTYGGNGNIQSSNSWPGVPASAVSAPEGAGRSVKARLSRSIEPIN